jgi:hypothetical protein
MGRKLSGNLAAVTENDGEDDGHRDIGVDGQDLSSLGIDHCIWILSVFLEPRVQRRRKPNFHATVAICIIDSGRAVAERACLDRHRKSIGAYDTLIMVHFEILLCGYINL